MELCLIWAQARNRAIGRANTLPWHLPEDLQHFKAQTLGCPVVMGRRTFESLPGGALPGRRSFVVTRTPARQALEGAQPCTSLQQALAAVTHEPRVFVIGGAQLYREALFFADRLLVTEIDLDVPDADAFAPEIPSRFALEREGAWTRSRTGLVFRFLEYQRAS